MTQNLKSKTRSDFYVVNNDFLGTRVVKQQSESVQFRNNTLTRIWYNDLNKDYEPHCHSAMEIIIPIENYYEARTSQTTYKVNPDEILIIPPGIMHELKSPETGIRFIYLFDISFMTKLNGYQRLETSVFDKPICMTKASNPKLYDEFMQALIFIRNEYFDNKEFSDFSIFAVLLNLFSKLGYQEVSGIDFINTPSSRQNEYTQKFQDVLNYIDDHYTEDIDMEQIASKVGFSKYHFSRLFKQYTNYTFCDYINYRRIKAAEELLSDRDLPVTDVALSAGFTSISTFNRLFKQIKGCSPSEYRAKNMIIDFSRMYGQSAEY